MILQWLSQEPGQWLSYDTLVCGVAGLQCCPSENRRADTRGVSRARYQATLRAIRSLERRGWVATRWERGYGGRTRARSARLSVDTSEILRGSERLTCRYCVDRHPAIAHSAAVARAAARRGGAE